MTKNAVKIAVLIGDAPPHGLEPTGDTWPNGKNFYLGHTKSSGADPVIFY